jgi:hypothetical protein
MNDMLFSLYLEEENTIRPNPISKSSGLCIAKFSNPGNRSQTRQPLDNSSCSDEIFYALPQSKILSSSPHEVQIMTRSSAKS